MRRFVVASASPRRRELLSNAGYTFEVIPSDADETLPDGISARDAVFELAKRKAHSVLKNETDAVVLGCDTVVSLDGKILGKPPEERMRFLPVFALRTGKKRNASSPARRLSSILFPMKP